jgi:outer membrane beta-barrel protein
VEVIMARSCSSLLPILITLIVTLVVAMPSRATAQHEEQVAPLLDRFWHPQVVAVQPRQVEKARAIELVGVVGVVPNDAFLIYMPLGFRGAYHLTEHWALELSFEYFLRFETSLRQHLEQNDAQLRARIRDSQEFRADLGLAWSPVYGKIAAAGGVLHFDGYLVAGAGLVRIAEEKELDLPAASRPDFLLGAGLKLFFGRRWVVRFEYRQYLYLRPEDLSGGGGGVGLASEIALCGGLLIGGRR